MSARPHPNRMSQEIERELARRLDAAKREHTPAEVAIAGTRYRLVPVDEPAPTAEEARLAKSNLRKHFGSVAPRRRPEDFAALRQEFERGVAEDALTRGQQ